MNPRLVHRVMRQRKMPVKTQVIIPFSCSTDSRQDGRPKSVPGKHFFKEESFRVSTILEASEPIEPGEDLYPPGGEILRPSGLYQGVEEHGIPTMLPADDYLAVAQSMVSLMKGEK